MKTYRYTLQPYKGSNTRYTCPQCGRKGVFVRYIDTLTGEHLADDTGRCNREQQCGYHKPPSSEIKNQKEKSKIILSNPKKQILHPTPSSNHQIITSSNQLTTIYEQSLCCYNTNALALYIWRTYGWAAMERVFDAYRIGTHGNSTVFWQIDTADNIRAGKVMAYHADTGKRIKNETNAIQWMHSIHKLQDYTLHQCLFGEHLLPHSTLPVAIAESEKTAIVASIHAPQYLWLATGGIHNLSVAKLNVLKGRRIVLFPDAGAYTRWNSIATQVSQCTVSTVLQHISDGSDIADYL